jgi:hypothetical protein
MTWNGDCKAEGCEREAVDSSGYCKKHKPQMSEPTAQEWTAETIKQLCNNGKGGFHAIADAHKAVLAAERRETEKELAAERDKGFEECRVVWKRCEADLKAHYEGQLAAERELADERQRVIVELGEKLAAEREKVKNLQQWWESEKRAYLSCQEQLAAREKPLVDALEKVRQKCDGGYTVPSRVILYIIENALAKVKEGKHD